MEKLAEGINAMDNQFSIGGFHGINPNGGSLILSDSQNVGAIYGGQHKVELIKTGNKIPNFQVPERSFGILPRPSRVALLFSQSWRVRGA